MCNYEIEKDLLINGVALKACDFETEEVVERKGTRKPANRGQRRKATAKAKRRATETDKICKAKRAKAERDNEIMYFCFSNGRVHEIHDSKLWKPMNNKARTSS